MLKIVLASKNSGKLKEFNYLFKNTNFELIPISEFTNEEIEETGTSYEENAFIKAKFALDISGLPSLGDDSGLEVESLNGEPGIFSARYAGEKGNDILNNNKLLDELSLKKDKSAKFVSILSFLHPELKTSLFSYGELFGKIINSPRGKGGFGYDPIFQIKNSKLTLAEISEEKRMKISHRTISTLKMINLLNESKM
ncbi:MAG: non-canonical purine NTP pyrophosphatase, RdgB/HAM1 family [Gammaproteobacteria bacterium]|nr:non-canonical purine NTP pyrophosphatase, RdgB/HAM1 family [Gammaproteobacteria bacterium]